MELLAIIYRAGGLNELILGGALFVAFLLLRAHANRQNAESVSITTNATLLRDSTTDLRVQREAYNILRDDKTVLQHELDRCNESMTAAAYEQAACQTQLIRLQQELQIQRNERNALRADLQEAHEALFILNNANIELRKELDGKRSIL